jgi:hypothetical protein
MRAPVTALRCRRIRTLPVSSFGVEAIARDPIHQLLHRQGWCDLEFDTFLMYVLCSVFTRTVLNRMRCFALFGQLLL